MLDTPTRQTVIVSALALALVAACAASGGPSASATIASPTMPEPIPYDDLAPVEIRILGDPDVIGVGFGSVWVKTDAGSVTRVDPATADVVADLQIHGLDGPGCNGIGVGSAGIWSCDAGDLVRIDPATDTWAAPISTRKVWSQLRLVVTGGRIWVLAGDGSELVGLSEATGALGEPIVLPGPCTDLGTAGDRLYVVCEQAGRVLAVDPATGTVMADVPAAQPKHVSASTGDVWVVSDDGLLQLASDTLATRRAFPTVRVGYLGGIVADKDGVWVRRIDPFLTRIDAATGEITHVISAPFTDGGDVAVEADHLWATAGDEGVLVRLDLPAGP